jgi:hypothetical protein
VPHRLRRGNDSIAHRASCLGEGATGATTTADKDVTMNETTTSREEREKLYQRLSGQLSREQRADLVAIIDSAQERQADELNALHENVLLGLAVHFPGFGPAIVGIAQHVRANLADPRRLDHDLRCHCVEPES